MRSIVDAQKHPYIDFEKTELWQLLEKALRELQDNSDIKIQTDPSYVVGYLAKTLTENGVIKSK
jgi:hypothetical protein